MGQLFSQQETKSVNPATHGTTETTLLGAGVGSLTLVASFFSAGQSLVVEGTGGLAAALASSATLTIRLKKGSTVLATTQAIAVPDVFVGVRWWLRALISGRSATSIHCLTAFEFSGPNRNDGQIWQMPAYAGSIPTGLVTISSSAEAIGLTAQWGTSSLNNEEITCGAFALSTP